MSKEHEEMIEKTGTRALQWKAELSLKKEKKSGLRYLIRSYKYLYREQEFVNAGLLSL